MTPTILITRQPRFLRKPIFRVLFRDAATSLQFRTAQEAADFASTHYPGTQIEWQNQPRPLANHPTKDYNTP